MVTGPLAQCPRLGCRAGSPRCLRANFQTLIQPISGRKPGSRVRVTASVSH